MTGALPITGNIRERFVQTAVLLRLLDPVRGEPTTYGLDQDSHSTQAPRQQILKRKFIDSLALICATRRDADTVSAATLEEGGPDGAVVRIASNAGVTEETQNDLRDMLRVLESIAVRDLDVIMGEEVILLKIVRLDIEKIRQYLKALKQAFKLFEKHIPAMELRLVEEFPNSTPLSIRDFLVWYKQIFSIQALPPQPDVHVLLDWVKWALEARRSHLQFVRVAFSNHDQPLPRWVGTIMKIGRYGIAARALVTTACKIPALFDAITVKPLAAASRERFVLRDTQIPLTCALRRVPEIKAEELVPRLASLWNISDIESHFRNSCPIDLVVHAELQIVSFYDHNPQLRPRSRFIGVSKKSCFLCQMFLNLHPAGFFVSGCHQKLYTSWIAPSATNDVIYKQYKAITAGMSVAMEAIARQDLTCRLGSKRSPVPADSTAGISLNGLTDLGNSMAAGVGKNTATEADCERYVEIRQPHSILQTNDYSPPLQPPKTLAIQAQSPYSQLTGPGESGLPDTGSTPSVARPSPPLVLLFKDAYDERRQDIIAVTDVLDPHTGCPSWSILVDLLQSAESLGFTFKDSDVMIVDRRLRVRNERQFMACLQHLKNDGILNADVQISNNDVSSAPSSLS